MGHEEVSLVGDVLARRRFLSAARDRLLERADADLSEVPRSVAASWRRSLARGVDPAAVVNAHHPDLDLDSRLVRCARPLVARLAEQIAGVPVCVVLTDDRARLLVRVDTTAAMGRAADGNRLAEGFAYDEGAVGTNGVGTVLEAGAAVHIVGAEHFVEPLQPYACAGAPVRDPLSGRVVGVLDVSCRAESSSPVLLSLVTSAAAGIQDALLHDRDVGQQAVLDLFTRVDARSRAAVLAVGRSVVLTNAELRTTLDPLDLAALQDHARFRATRGPEVDDRLELPSGARVRLRGRAVAVGDAVAGVVAVVQVLREAGSAAAPVPAPGRRRVPPPVSTSLAWRQAWSAAAQALGAGTPLLVAGESGSGRRHLLRELDAALHGPGRVVELGPGDPDPAARVRAAGASPLVVLRDVDGWTDVPRALPAALHATRARLAATAGEGARCGGAVQEVLGGVPRSVVVPPLRDRPGDLALLVADLLAERAPGRDVRLSAAALRTLAGHSWPGNVGELAAAVDVALRRRRAGVVQVGDLPESCQSTSRGALRPVDRAERDAIVGALRDSAGNRVTAAAALGVARSTLYRKIAQYGITA